MFDYGLMEIKIVLTIVSLHAIVNQDTLIALLTMVKSDTMLYMINHLI